MCVGCDYCVWFVELVCDVFVVVIYVDEMFVGYEVVCFCEVE